jgi:hypothetical protein
MKAYTYYWEITKLDGKLVERWVVLEEHLTADGEECEGVTAVGYFSHEEDAKTFVHALECKEKNEPAKP